jgi:hypothetical protein
MTNLTTPEHMLLLGVDVKGYGDSPTHAHGRIQADLVGLLDDAGRAAGVDRSVWCRQAQGDEELSAIPMPGAGIRVIDPLLRYLATTLFRFNEGRREDSRIRLRVAVHQGWVTPAANGWGGRAVVDVSRLLNSAPLREALASRGERDLAVLISRPLYRQVVLAGLTSFRAEEFARVTVREKEFVDEAWLWCSTAWTSSGGAGESLVGEPDDGPRQHAETEGSSAAVQAGRDATVINGDGNTVNRTEVGTVAAQRDVTFGVSHVER